MDNPGSRRLFLCAGGVALLAAGTAHATDDEEISPTEDLMREHGVLRRLLLIYEEAVRRIETSLPIEADWIAHSAKLVRAFVEDYHERNEEQHIFPRLQKVKGQGELVTVLTQQHQIGRKLTAEIERLATPGGLGKAGDRRELARSMRAFVRMYEPHAAREDTVLFPAFVRSIGKREQKKLADTFERAEQALPLGNFEKMVDGVAALEVALGIHDLAAFTPSG
jgi:hemerythrin-like domain-containing protein